MNSLGPFPISAVIVALSLLAGWLLVRAWARRLPDSPHKVAGAQFIDAALVGLLAARLGGGARGEAGGRRAAVARRRLWGAVAGGSAGRRGLAGRRGARPHVFRLRAAWPTSSGVRSALC